MNELGTQVPVQNHGWRVTFAGMGINLALGILYTWSVISKGVPAEWGWSETDKSLPYMFACLVFAIIMVPAGRMQDKIGPKVVAAIGGLLVGIGFIIASQTAQASASAMPLPHPRPSSGFMPAEPVLSPDWWSRVLGWRRSIPPRCPSGSSDDTASR
jgi:MFS family permease